MFKGFFLYFILIHFFIISSCSENKKNSSVSLNDIRPKSNFEYKNKKAAKNDSTQLILEEYNQDSIYLNIKHLHELNESNFLNRFPHLKSAIRSITTSDSSIHFTHEFYIYKDSLQMKNAFFNWLDCNGQKCISIKLYEERKIEPCNFLLIASAVSIDIIRCNKIFKPEDWIRYVRFNRKQNDYKYILFQKADQKAKWFVFKDNKLNLMKHK